MDKKIIEEIAGYLDCGFNCFLHKTTHELKCIPDMDLMETDEEEWVDEIAFLESDHEDYKEIERMEPGHSFRIMADFVNTVVDISLVNKLNEALQKSKPFQNFKLIINRSGNYRERWFEFKKRRIIKWVESQLE
ncbi:MAG: UPF0158 family protein [Saprospiraceae bacterium]